MDEGNTDRRKWPPELASLDRPPSERIPRAERNQVMWSWVAVTAMVFILGVTFYAIDARQDQRHALQSPPAAPSLASDRAPALATTPGRTAPAETTGQGEPSDDRRSGDSAAP